jgi:aspartate-semialdehyde dehydrogenase
MKLIFLVLGKIKQKKNTIDMWIVSDNLLRGAALNAVEIAELLIRKNNG